MHSKINKYKILATINFYIHLCIFSSKNNTYEFIMVVYFYRIQWAKTPKHYVTNSVNVKLVNNAYQRAFKKVF